MTGDPRRILGARAERVVAERYTGRGYRVLSANWRCTEGELDLVLETPDAAHYVFCEVKARRSAAFGTALDAVTQTKQRRLRRLAARWLAERRSSGVSRPPTSRHLRFDVAAVTPGLDGSFAVEVLEGAF